MYKITKVITCICLWCSGSFKVLDCQTKASLLHVYIHPMCHFFLFPKTVINDCFEEVNFNFSADCIFIQRTIAYWCKFYEYFSTHKNHEQLQNYGQIDARFHPAGVSLSFSENALYCWIHFMPSLTRNSFIRLRSWDFPPVTMNRLSKRNEPWTTKMPYVTQ